MTAAPAPPARHALMIHPRCDNGPLRVHSFISWESFMRKLAAILALSLVASSPALSFPVVRSNGTCLGVVRASVLRAASSGSAGLRVDALVQGAPVLRDAEGLAVGASALVGSGVGVALIVDADERLTGVLRPEDVLRTLAAHGDID